MTRAYRFLVAQLVERSTVNRQVGGSSPPRGAIEPLSSVVERRIPNPMTWVRFLQRAASPTQEGIPPCLPRTYPSSGTVRLKASRVCLGLIYGGELHCIEEAT